MGMGKLGTNILGAFCKLNPKYVDCGRLIASKNGIKVFRELNGSAVITRSFKNGKPFKEVVQHMNGGKIDKFIQTSVRNYERNELTTIEHITSANHDPYINRYTPSEQWASCKGVSRTVNGVGYVKKTDCFETTSKAGFRDITSVEYQSNLGKFTIKNKSNDGSSYLANITGPNNSVNGVYTSPNGQKSYFTSKNYSEFTDRPGIITPIDNIIWARQFNIGRNTYELG